MASKCDWARFLIFVPVFVARDFELGWKIWCDDLTVASGVGLIFWGSFSVNCCWMKFACVRGICWCKFVRWCGRSDADAADVSEYSATNSVGLSQLLMAMTADSSEQSQQQQQQPSCQYQCQCITEHHQPAVICIEHFTITADDERRLSNIAGNSSHFICLIVPRIILTCMHDQFDMFPSNWAWLSIFVIAIVRHSFCRTLWRTIIA